MKNEKPQTKDIGNKEALRVFRAAPARWQPIMTDGELQRSDAIMPLIFKLES